MTNQQELVAKFLSSVALPNNPEVVVCLVKTLNLDSVTVNEVGDIIAKDHGITSTVLRIANSPRFGLPTKVATVADAIRILGLDAVRSIAVGVGVRNAFPTTRGLDKSEFLASSDFAAELAYRIAGAIHKDKSIAWLVGFLGRVGEVLIAIHDPASVEVIEKVPRSPGHRWKREVSLFGLSEGELIGELARRWNFPDAVVTALERSADPLNEKWTFHDHAAIGHIAGLLADVYSLRITGVEQVEHWLPIDVLAELGLEPSKLLAIYEGALSAA